MKVLTGPPKGWNHREPTATAVGVFDGVHAGHQAVISAVTEGDNLVPAVLTFRNHPAGLLSTEGPPPLLATLDQRLELLEAHGIEIAALVDFDQRLRSLDPEAFAAGYLADGLKARSVAVGADFRFGYRAAGTVETLERLGETYGFSVSAVAPITMNGSEVRSSRIRSAIESGQLEAAAELLGRLYTLRGEVVRGEGRGATIGIPTANIIPDPAVAVPARGVYAGRAVIGGATVAGVANIGVRPTFDGSTLTLEVHLFDFTQDIYGAVIDVALIRHLRPEQRFESVDALVTQIHADVAAAKAVLAQTP